MTTKTIIAIVLAIVIGFAAGYEIKASADASTLSATVWDWNASSTQPTHQSGGGLYHSGGLWSNIWHFFSS
ncbi:MAG TPA: hypothetical protein VHB93_02365 [Candidatus Paceibacterota bacterium]|nr:hypothetical protein [Candidatus Paceibacterota bacterium]